MEYIVIFLFVTFFGTTTVWCTIELFPTYNSVGVTKFTDDSRITICQMQYCTSSKTCHDGYSLTRVTDKKLVGSIFWLTEDSEIEVFLRCGKHDDVVGAFVVLDGIESKSTRTLRSRSFPEISDALKVLYVGNVSVSTSCTESQPCSLTESIPKITNGTHVILRSGRYYFGDTTLDVSGTSQNPIVFHPYGDGEVILDGSEEITGLSPHTPSGVFRTSYVKSGEVCNVVMIRKSDGERTRLVRYRNRTQFEMLYYKSPVDGTPNYGYYLNLTGSEKTFDVNIGSLTFSEYEFRFGIREYLFMIRADYYYFSNLTVQFYGYENYRLGFYLRDSSYSWLRYINFDHNLISIYIKYKTDYTLIEHNTFKDSKYPLNWDSVKVDDGDGDLEAGGISLGTGGGGTSGRGLVIRYNRFDNFFDAFNLGSYSDSESDIYNLPSNEIDIHDNFVFKCRDDAFECDGICQNVRIFDNRFEYTLAGISLAPAKIGPTYVINNMIIDIHGWTGFKFIFGDHSLPSGSMFFFHNVVWNRIKGHAANIGYFPWQNSIWRNNIFLGYTRAISVGFNIGQNPISLNHDACFSNTIPFYWNGIGYMYSVEEFFEKTGQEMNGILLDYDLIFSDNQTMQLKTGTGLEKKGEYLKGINGLNPDIGRLFDHSLLPSTILWDSSLKNSICSVILFIFCAILVI